MRPWYLSFALIAVALLLSASGAFASGNPKVPDGAPPSELTGPLATACHRPEPQAKSSSSSPSNVSGSSLQVPDVVPGAASKMLPAGSNLVGAAVQAGSSNSQFRVVVTPAYLSSTYLPVLSETRIGVSTDTSTNLTTTTVGLSVNPFALQGPVAQRLLSVVRGAEKAGQCGASLKPVWTARAVACYLVPEDKESAESFQQWSEQIDRDTNGVRPELVTALQALHLGEVIDLRKSLSNSHKAVGEARKDLQKKQSAWVKAQVALAMAEKGGAVAAGGDPTAEDPALTALTNAQEAMIKAVHVQQEANTKLAEKVTEIDDSTVYGDCEKQFNVFFWPRLFSGWVPRFDATVGFDAYPWGAGTNPLDKTGTTTAPLSPWGGWRTEASLTFRPDERVELGVDGMLRHVRQSGAPFTQLAYYEGGAAFVEVLVWSPLISSDKADQTRRRARSTDYLKSGILPGLSLGVYGQGLLCQGFLNCASGQTARASVTPFVDYSVVYPGVPNVQLRVSVPVMWAHNIMTNATTGAAASSNPWTVTPTLSAVTSFVGF